MHVLCFEMVCYVLLWARNIVIYQRALTQKNLIVHRKSTYTSYVKYPYFCNKQHKRANVLWHNKLSVCCYLCNKFHGAASLLSDLRFLRHKGISSYYFVTRNSIFVFTKPTIGVYHICMPKGSNSHPIMIFLGDTFSYFSFIYLWLSGCFLCSVIPINALCAFLVCTVPCPINDKETLSMIYVT